MRGLQLLRLKRCGLGESDMLTGILGDEHSLPCGAVGLLLVTPGTVIYVLVTWFLGSSGIPTSVTLCALPSAASADLSGTVRAATGCTFHWFKARFIRAFRTDSVQQPPLADILSRQVEAVYKLVSEPDAEVPKEQTWECTKSVTNVTSFLLKRTNGKIDCG